MHGVEASVEVVEEPSSRVWVRGTEGSSTSVAALTNNHEHSHLHGSVRHFLGLRSGLHYLHGRFLCFCG